ncbi:MAG: polysaccharide biosynthesis protein [Clostridia bacterium]|nr:polysaccharide biosynthesis protein [Clostridia bacterium]
MKGNVMTEKQRSLIGGISVLGITGLICKVVGVLYRIPLNNSISLLGMNLYQKVFAPYNLLLAVTSAGIPVAISRMVSHYITLGEPGNARKVFRTALKLLSVLGIIVTVLLLLLARPIASAQGVPEGWFSYICIAPSLFFVCAMSAYRGYMQGMRNMLPTAVSQLIEQVGKVAVALPFASVGFSRGGWIEGSAGALLGTSLAECVAMLYMIIRCRFIKPMPAAADEKIASGRSLAKRIVLISIPITLGACIVPLASVIDSFMLTRLMENAGMLQEESRIRYSMYSSMVITMINVPTALAMAMSTNLVPSIASGLARKDKAYVAKEAGTGLRIAAVVGFPCSIGMSLLSKPILFLCYGDSHPFDHVLLAGNLLEFSAMTIILFTMVQATSGILQGAGRQKIPMFTLAAGMIIKVILNLLLVSRPEINIHGAPISSLVCYTVSMVPNLYFSCKYTGCRFSVSDVILRPLGASALMGAAVWAVYRFIFGGDRCLQVSGFAARLLPVVVCMAVGITVYLVSAVLLKAVRAEDLPARFCRKAK